MNGGSERTFWRAKTTDSRNPHLVANAPGERVVAEQLAAILTSWGLTATLLDAGNLDPTVLFAAPDAIRAQVRRVLEDYAASGDSDGHIFNLGHGISQFTPPEAVTVLVDEVHSFSRALRKKAA